MERLANFIMIRYYLTNELDLTDLDLSEKEVELAEEAVKEAGSVKALKSYLDNYISENDWTGYLGNAGSGKRERGFAIEGALEYCSNFMNASELDESKKSTEMTSLFEKTYRWSKSENKNKLEKIPTQSDFSDKASGEIETTFEGEDYNLDVDASVEKADFKAGRPNDEFHVDEINDGEKVVDSDGNTEELTNTEKDELVENPEFQDAASDDVRKMFADVWEAEQGSYDKEFDSWAEKNIISNENFEDKRFN